MKKHTYNDVFEASLKYFNDDELAAKVFVDKYSLSDKDGNYYELTPDDMHKRLAKEFAKIEKNYPNPMEEDEIYSLMKDFKFVIPQGSPMSAVGNPFFTQSAGNCFVINSPFDSYAGICKSDQELVQLMKRRAGVGLDISNIRPKGLSTNNAAKTTDGIAVFMERFSNSCREVAQNGRRGALLQSISIEHPEVETFIDIKKDLKKVTGANISIRLNDQFMSAVKDNKEFKLRWPVGSKKPVVSRDIEAKKLWNKIIDAAWSSAEPGIFFWDTILKNSPADIYGDKDPSFRTQSSNPCQPSWATVLTPSGISTIGNISVGDIIWSGKRWTKVINKMATGEKEVYGFRTNAGVFYGTENHRVVSDGIKIEVINAETIDVCFNKTLDDKDDNFQSAVIDGLVIGDGMVHKASNNKIVLLVGKKDQDYHKDPVREFLIEPRPGITDEAWSVKTSIQSLELPKTYERSVPDRFKFGSSNVRRGFLRGIYSANGSMVSKRITLKSASLKIIEDVQIMLSSLGIPSYYTTNKSHIVEFSNGPYECKESYDLNIGTNSGRKIFNELIGFIQFDKQEKLIKSIDLDAATSYGKPSYNINEKEFVAKEPVYDITVEAEEHTYWTGGLLVSNCGEITMGVDSCRLMVVNLLSFVKDPFQKNSSFDFELYKSVVIKAQRLMDDLIDLELGYIQKIIDKIVSDPEPEDIKSVELNLWKEFYRTCKSGRRTGLGITALGDTLAALNIKYGSSSSIGMTGEIYKILAVGAYTSSCIMAGERGPFPLYDYDLEKNHTFIKNIINQDKNLQDLYQKNGRRNIALTTTAPTGSVSTMTQTSSGIEPVFLLSYKRRKKINPSDKNAVINFTDSLGDTWQEFEVLHHGIKKWMEATKEKDVEKSPYFGATSNEVDWEASVDIQAEAQKWVCHSISKTCNLPNSATKDLVSKVYMRAYDRGCKGFTVYRDGCRSGVLISKDEEMAASDIEKNKIKSDEIRPNNITLSLAPKRPVELECEIKKVKIQGAHWTIFVGMLNNVPYEIFGGLSKYVDIPNKYKSGKIVKNGKVDGITTYNLVVGEGDDQMIIKDIANVFENANQGAFSRTISLSLRHGIPAQFVVEQLQKDKHSDITSFSKVIGRVLKQYIKNGTVATSEKKCPECNAEGSLVYQEGCLSCRSCNYAKC